MSIKQRSKPVNVTLWILSALGAALFLTAGGYKLADGLAAQFEAWGYPPGFDAAIGTLEMVGGFCLLFKRTAGWSAIGLMVIMLGAIWTHLSHGEMVAVAVPVATFVVLGLIAWGRGLPVQTKEQQQSRAPQSGAHPSPAS